MQYKTIEWKDISAKVRFSKYQPSEGVTEWHAMIALDSGKFNTNTQFNNIEKAIDRLRNNECLDEATLVLKRYFVSDIANQQGYLDATENVAVSIIEQPPLNGTKVAVWLWFIEGGQIYKESDGTRIFEHSAYKHLFNMMLQVPLKNELEETRAIFNNYIKTLSTHCCTLKNNCIRTWIYARNVDVHYAGLVQGRTECFDKENLTRDTHYIASTGIEGKAQNSKVLVTMDAYAIAGIQQSQIKYLHAPTRLDTPAEYGVTFERGTAVDYGDRRHIFISGTASIDNKGKIVHQNDVVKQAERTVDNIKALLNNAEANMSDVAKMIVYLRDVADYQLAKDFFEEFYPDIPRVITLAPVCRPGWLIEVECIAIKEIREKSINPF